MTWQADDNLKCHTLICGAGIAGLLLALELSARGVDVILATKDTLCDSNSVMAQGGLAAVTIANAVDSIEQHLSDTLSSGAGLTVPAVARHILQNGERLVNRLVELGVAFDSDVCREGGHGQARVLHTADATGRSIIEALRDKVLADPKIRVIEHAIAQDLIMFDGACAGVLLNCGGLLLAVYSQHTVLATGGIGRVFSRTTNPRGATGEGIAMAFRAGARVIDMEYVQFHPTAMALSAMVQQAPLVSEAVRGAGGTLLDRNGRRFAFDFDHRGELATRDIVARAIATTMFDQQTPCVWLDLRPIGEAEMLRHFPNIIATSRSYGVNPVKEPIPVAPAAHYFMGGIWTDITGRTSIDNLYAIGECASTGLHGANRLASNSLLEGGVGALVLADEIAGAANISIATFGSYAGGALTETMAPLLLPVIRPDQLPAFQEEMFHYAGLTRDADGLVALLASIEMMPASVVHRQRVKSSNGLADRATIELGAVAQVGWLVATAALRRTESRGAHYRTDFLAQDDMKFRHRYWMSRSSTGTIDVMDQSPAVTGSNLVQLTGVAL